MELNLDQEIKIPPKKRKTKTKTNNNPIDLNFITPIINSYITLKFPEYALTNDEIESLNNAIKEVLKHYNFNISDKQMAIYNLIAVTITLSIPRIIIAIETKKQDKKEETKEITTFESNQGEKKEENKISDFEMDIL